MAFPISYFKTRLRTEPDWIIPNFLKRKNTAFIMGSPKRACKSWLLLNLAWDLSEGKPIWNVFNKRNGAVFQPTRPMRVVYFTQEDAEDDIQDRAEIIFKTRMENDHLFISPKNLENMLDSPAGNMRIHKELAEVVKGWGPVDLVIFDPMRRMHTKDENSSESIAIIWQALHKIHESFNCATFFAHHTKKPSEGKGLTGESLTDMTSPYAGRGSGDIYGGGDAFINVVEHRLPGAQPSKRRYVDLHFQTKRGQQIPSLRAHMNFETGLVGFDHWLSGKDKNRKIEYDESDPEMLPIM